MSTRERVDFRQLKAEVSIETVLAHYGVQMRSTGGAELRGRCPLPMHTSSRSRDSFAVNVSRNVWTCRSRSCVQGRGGRLGGDAVDLVALMEGCSVREAALKMKNGLGAGQTRTVAQPRPAPEAAAAPNPPLRFALTGIEPDHPYLAARGLTSDTVRAFGVGHYSGKGLHHGRMVIPIHDERGQLIAYAGRAIDDQDPKYRLAPGFRNPSPVQPASRPCGRHADGGRGRRLLGRPRRASGWLSSRRRRADGIEPVPTTSRALVHPFQPRAARVGRRRARPPGRRAIARGLTGRIPLPVIALDREMQPDQLRPEEIQRLVNAAAADMREGERGDVLRCQPGALSTGTDRPQIEEITMNITAQHDADSLTVKILPNEDGKPAGKLADAELHFGDDSPLRRLKLVGFSAPRRR